MKPKYHGTYWSVGEMNTLKELVRKEGLSVEQAAKKLFREPSACADRLRIINTAEMLMFGSSDDNLMSWKAKNKNRE